MEDQTHSNPTTTTTTTTTLSSSTAATGTAPATEPVRSRWTPKPEQILILESIFNSGMVNPPKDETVRIRKLLEQYGPVGDANVFYWFQNRRSRSRRRQRQLQAASLQLQPQPVPPTAPAGGGPVFEYGAGASSSSASASAPLLLGFQNNNNSSSTNSNNNNIIMSGRSSTAASFQVGAANASPEYEFKDDSGGGGLSLSAAHLGFLPPQDNPNCFPFHLPPGGGFITVFVNGVATQVPAGSFDVKAMFGEEGVLVHSTGVPVPINEFGITLHSLHHGDTYFLVPRLA